MVDAVICVVVIVIAVVVVVLFCSHTALAIPKLLAYVARAGGVGSDTMCRSFFADAGVQYACSLDERF